MSAAESLGKYEIRRTLGRGAMGTVYEGFDPLIERVVAIKTVRLPEVADSETAEEIARFRREAQAAGRLTHPNIVGVFDYGETADLAYIVMEFVDGPSVKELLDKNERFPLPRIVQVMDDLLTGLQFSHERGVVHRDIKPANLMLTKSGQAKIADFGIARIDTSSMTMAGTVLGTPAYMSPEQFMGQVVDARTDIYSSGVLLYQLLTGERPFEGSMSAIMHKALHTEAPLPSEISVTAPRPFDAVVRKAMAKRPEDRYGSAAEFMTAIRAAMSAPATAREDTGDATMVVTPRAPAQGTQRAGAELSVAELAASIAPAAGAPPGKRGAVTGGGTARGAGSGTGKSSRMPVILGGGVVGLAVLGGVGYFLLTGNSGIQQPPTAPETPPVISTQPAPPASPPASSAPTTGPASAPASGHLLPPVTTPPSSEPTSPPVATLPPAPGPILPPVATPVPQTPPVLPPSSPEAQSQPPVSQPTPVLPPTTTPQVTLAQPPTAGLATPVPPPPVAPAVDPADAMRTAIAAFVSRLPCSLLGGDVQNGTAQVTGISGRTAVDSLRQKLTSLGLTNPALRVTQVDEVFCPWEDFLRPFAKPFGDASAGLALHLAGDPPWLVNDDYIRPRLTMAGFRGQLRVDYLDHLGNVQHLYPQIADPRQHVAGDPPHVFEAGEALRLGDPVGGNRGWQVAKPFGTDVIIAIASEDALFDRPRRTNVEAATAYLRDLTQAVDLARSRGARVSATAIAVETRLK